MYRILVAFYLLFMSLNIKAQSDPEYLMEIGMGVGGINYVGDFNSSVTKNIRPFCTILYRRLFNPHIGLRVQMDYGTLKGSSSEVETYYPDLGTQNYTFSNTLVGLGSFFEYNLWPYGTGRDFRGAKRFTPYIFGGLSACFVKTESKNIVVPSIPLGLGVKYKIGDRLNLGIQWTAYFSSSDELDGYKDPYKIESSGLFKNADGYTNIMISLTYSFKAKCRTCHNDDY